MDDFEEWVEDAREQINETRDNHGLTVQEAVEKVAQRRSWRTPEALRYLHEAEKRILKSLEKASTSGNATQVVNNVDFHGGWYSPNESAKQVHWPLLAENIKRDLGESAFESIDAASSRVIDGLGRPYLPKLQTKGLVIGYVQSGKTTNFTSVIAKAADQNYRLIIVLAGMTDSLRKQTQTRIESDLVRLNPRKWHLLTSDDQDFTGDKNPHKLSDKSQLFLAVIKKNQAPLKKLNDWIHSAGESGQSAPILIIDDEADQASINVRASSKTKADQSRINAAIRELTSHPRTSYVAYTATPFANILIDSNENDDLYPRDFIQVLDYPQGYFGAAQLFGRDILAGEDPDDFNDDSINAIRLISDEEIEKIRPRAREVDEWQFEFVDSLRDAVYWFFIATAMRRFRTKKKLHSSMLIHTSPLTKAHRSMQNKIKDEVRKIQSSIQTGSAKTQLSSMWEQELKKNPLNPEYENPDSFEELWDLISSVAHDSEIIMDNNKSDKRLDYENEGTKTVIVVGGSTLSRGLTLEGLVSSYFARTTKTYDTLLQMGRWFGFRKGYEDLIRIWMPEELKDWYRDLATIEEDLRREIAFYEINNRTPLEMKARIRKHPNMEVTSRAKQHNAVTRQMSFSGQRIQTISFQHQNQDWIDHNRLATEKLLSKTLQQAHSHSFQARNGSYLINGVPVGRITDFLEDYAFDSSTSYGDQRMALLLQYIRREVQSSSLTVWNISVFGQKSDKLGKIDLGLPHEINLLSRSKILGSAPGHANINTLVGPIDRLNDIVDPVLRKKIQKELKEAPAAKVDGLTRLRHEQHAGRGVGHLAIYAIDKDSQPRSKSSNEEKRAVQSSRTRAPLEAVDHLIGIGIFLPESQQLSSGVEYTSGSDHLEDDVVAENQALENEFQEELE